jgi:integrase
MVLFVGLAIDICMRRRELAYLEWQDVDLEKRGIAVSHGKTGARQVPLSGRAVHLLCSARSLGGTNCNHPTFEPQSSQFLDRIS